MAKKTYEEAKIRAIADKIREKTGDDTTYKTSEMPKGIEAVYTAGQNSIFERIQNFGKAQNYYYAFAYDRFDDTNFLPIYPIRCSNGTTPGRYMFYYSSNLTDTKVEIVTNSNNIDYAFCGCTNLKTIRKLTVTETTTMINTFVNCSSLVNITFSGTIGQSLSLKDSSLLSDKSIEYIASCLKDLTDTTSKTLTLHKNGYERIENSSQAAYIRSKNWILTSA